MSVTQPVTKPALVSAFIMHHTPLALGKSLAGPLLLQQAVSLTRYAKGLLQQAWGSQGVSESLQAVYGQSAHTSQLSPAEILQYLGRSQLSETEAVEQIETYLAHPDAQSNEDLIALYRCFWAKPRYQQTVLLAIGRTRHPASLHFLEGMYRTAWHNLALRQTILRALGLHGSAEAVARLVEVIQQMPDDHDLLKAVIMALGYSQSAASARILAAFLNQYASLELRGLIYRALAATASDTAVEVLRKQAKATSGEEKKIVQAALQHAHRNQI